MWTSRSLSIDRHHPPLSLTTRRMGSSQLLTHGFRPLQLRYFTVSTSPSPYRILTQNCFFCHSSLPPPPLSLSSFFTSSASTRLLARGRNLSRRSTSGESESVQERDELGEVEQKGEEEVAGILLEGNMKEREANAGRIFSAVMEAIPEENSAVASACLVGLLTGIGVVLFNNGVHELRDFFWDGIPYRGASWLREEPIAVTWKKIVLVPVCGGVLVSFLNTIRDATEVPSTGVLMTRVKAVARPVLKSLAACITLGTGNSLGPEGPSVEIGSSIAKGVGTLLDKSAQRKVSLMAAGSAAGISSGFNAAVAGCFFAVESVLWPSPSNSSTSLLNTTSMVILSAVTASVISAVGLGSEPAFKVPNYDFRSPTELPLYLFLGILCGLVSLALSRCTTYMLQAAEHINISGGVPKSVFPIGGSLAVGLIALAYPEILYWGFQNVDLLLESRPFVKGLPADLLLQLVVVKIIATSLCRATGLVGGYYAPSLFIGAATGMAYGKFLNIAISQSHPVLDISFFEVASPQAYALVGMAATLAGVCQVPLTSVLLLFELTQDYRIVLPLLGAVGLSTWITSTLTKEDTGDSKDLRKSPLRTAKENESDSDFLGNGASSISDALCDLESSLCVDISDEETRDLERRISVLQAMRTNHVIIFLSTFLVDAVDMMLAAKQPCALIIDDATYLIGLLSLEDIEDFCKCETSTSKEPEELVVADMYSMVGQKYHPPCVVTPNTSLMRAQMLMSRHSMSHMPVVLLDSQDSRRGQPVGIIDMEGIKLACRAVAAKEYLNQNFEQQEP